MAEGTGKPKIGNGNAAALIAAAIAVDGVQALLAATVFASVLASLITFGAAFGFWLWFMILGVKYDGKKALTGLGSVVAELVPMINALPAMTAGVVMTIILDRLEAKKAVYGSGARDAAVVARFARMQATRNQMLERRRLEQEAREGNRGQGF